MRISVLILLLVCGPMAVFPQDEITQRGSIPEELLRPRREEAPRYPIDTVIGILGPGRTPKEAYDLARRTAAAFLAGSMDVPVLSSVNKVFLEGWMSKLEEINPRSFRLGGGREEPDGAVSYLVRFVGREQGISGELFIRYEERYPEAPVPLSDTEIGLDSESESADLEVSSVSVEKVWIFEDLILEEARSREVENTESRHRFDFPPYERFF